MDALQMFYYATVGSVALVFLIERARSSIRNTVASWKRRKAQALNKRFQAAFESVEPNVALWWEDKGRKEMRPDNVPMLDMMPEPLKEQILEQHADTIKRAAAQLAGGLVLRQDGNLKPNEATAIDDEIDVLRQHLIDHGIDTDSFEKLFT